jgi:protein SCO1/2
VSRLPAYALLSCLLLSSALQALPQDSLLENVTFHQYPGDKVALKSEWKNEMARPMNIAAFQEAKPMLLVLAWYECEGLCPVLLQNLLDALRAQSIPSQDYRVVVVSIDPGENPATARKMRQHLELRAGGKLSNWAFLTGNETAIAQMSESVGFESSYDVKRDRYAHPAGVVVVSPDGEINRYLLGLRPSPNDVKLALVAAGEGRVGSVVHKILLRCYHFDPETGQYNLAVLRLLQILGVAFLLLLVAGFIYLQRRRSR